MNIEQFNQAIEIIFDCFSVPNGARKASRYYQFFKTENLKTLEDAFVYIARTDEKFPTPNRLSQVITMIKSQSAFKDPVQRVDCKWCKGDGRVSSRDASGRSWAYRCQCANGARFPNYPAWFGNEHKDKELIGNAYEDVAKNPAIYRKANGIKIPAEVEAKMLGIIEKKEESIPF